MNFYEHCNICINSKTNLQDGITCGLTTQKPSFDETCPDIRFNKEFEKKLGLIHIEIERLKKRKRLIYIKSCFFMVLGCGLMFGANSLMEITHKPSVYEFKIKLAIIVIGFALSSFGYKTLHQFIKKTKNFKEKKNKIDLLLNKYLIKYSCNIDFGKKYHGNQEITFELKSENHLLKNSKITYEIKDYLDYVF
ncbi:hypothetical protein [Snuella lapsa]|uniref:SMODS and SLOG-associating 2TM effector domain-containing protein n=1 Tax=Snuella lapsa TaxID=870481 RepID=A0ABP6WTT2_9FLAO